MNVLLITKLFPTEFSKNTGIFNKIFLEYFSNNFHDISFNVIRPIPMFKNYKVKNFSIKFHRKINKTLKYNIYYPIIISFGKFLFKYHHINYFYKINKFIKKNNINFDIIHSHWLYPDCYISVKLGKKYNKPVIIHCHGSDINQLMNNKKIEAFNKETLFDCSRIIVVSEALKNKIIDKYPELHEKIIVIHNGINLSEYNKIDINDSMRYLNIKSENIKRIIFVGNISISKGINEIIEAAHLISSEINNFKIHIIGKGNNNYIKQCKHLIQKYKLTDRIIFEGEVQHNNIKHWFNIADFSILPSYSEGFPMVILESLSSNTPVIATKVGGIPELLNDENKGILIEPRNSKQLSDAILKYIKYKNKANNIIKNLETYDQKYQAGLIYNLYNEVLNNKGSI
jgi:glycosyltransferase involved in cell wall biosynthesis